jgi:hypothetical protein
VVIKALQDGRQQVRSYVLGGDLGLSRTRVSRSDCAGLVAPVATRRVHLCTNFLPFLILIAHSPHPCLCLQD